MAPEKTATDTQAQPGDPAPAPTAMDTTEQADIFDSAGDGVKLIAQDQVIGHGVSAEHVTETGIDVSGLRYLSFQSGITVYYSGSDAMAVSTGTEAG
jgi:hypothetical protein